MFTTVEKDIKGNYVADGDASVAPRPSGGTEAADRNAQAWLFVKGLQGFEIVGRTADGEEHVLMRGVGNSKDGRYTGVMVRTRAVQNMDEPKQAVAEVL